MGNCLKITLVIITFQLCVFAESIVLRVEDGSKYLTISQNYIDPWSIGDEVCIVRVETEIACGLVKFVDPESAIVKISRYSPKVEKREERSFEKTFIELEMSSEKPEENDSVKLLTKNPKKGIFKTLRELASTNPFNARTISYSENETEGEEKNKLDEMRKLKSKIYWDDDLNPVSAISLGLDYAWPFVEYTQSISSKVAMTVRAVKLAYPVGDGFLDGIGGYLTHNYFPNRPLRGLWFQTGFGVYSLKVSKWQSTSSVWTPGIIGTIGYKVVWRENISFGFAGGVEYLPLVNSGKVALDFSGFIPSCLISAGYFF